MATRDEIIAEAKAEVDVAMRLLNTVGVLGRRPASLDAAVEAVKRAKRVLEWIPAE